MHQALYEDCNIRVACTILSPEDHHIHVLQTRTSQHSEGSGTFPEKNWKAQAAKPTLPDPGGNNVSFPGARVHSAGSLAQKDRAVQVAALRSVLQGSRATAADWEPLNHTDPLSHLSGQLSQPTASNRKY